MVWKTNNGFIGAGHFQSLSRTLFGVSLILYRCSVEIPIHSSLVFGSDSLLGCFYLVTCFE